MRRTDALPAEKLDYVDVTIVLSGSMEYAINRQKASLRAGDAVVFHVGDVRERKEGGSAEYYSFNVSPDPGDGLPRLSGVLRGALTEEAGMLLDLFLFMALFRLFDFLSCPRPKRPKSFSQVCQ